ncbi:NUDIX domain-containing protein [Halosegnis longus]|uniref:NUDIX domain-containing protein n=1 Tax=Halosegnis longus TaxID=2216012 RepID=UPI00096A703A|nr:NUDIX hydrolase [Salella cibi]
MKDAPRQPQTLRLSESRLAELELWAVDGTGRAAAARVRDSAGRLALIRNEWADGWFLPGGGVEAGETPRAAARREVREETGLDAEIGEPLVVLDQRYCDENGDEWFTAEYVVFDARADGELADADALGVHDGEIHDARWVSSLPDDFHEHELLAPYLQE